MVRNWFRPVRLEISTLGHAGMTSGGRSIEGAIRNSISSHNISPRLRDYKSQEPTQKQWPGTGSSAHFFCRTHANLAAPDSEYISLNLSPHASDSQCQIPCTNNYHDFAGAIGKSKHSLCTKHANALQGGGKIEGAIRNSIPTSPRLLLPLLASTSFLPTNRKRSPHHAHPS